MSSCFSDSLWTTALPSWLFLGHNPRARPTSSFQVVPQRWSIRQPSIHPFIDLGPHLTLEQHSLTSWDFFMQWKGISKWVQELRWEMLDLLRFQVLAGCPWLWFSRAVIPARSWSAPRFLQDSTFFTEETVFMWKKIILFLIILQQKKTRHKRSTLVGV